MDNVTGHIKSLGIALEEWAEEDSNGLVRYAQLPAFGNTTHTLVERNNYPKEMFLPNWSLNPLEETVEKTLWSRLPQPGLDFIDHLALNQLAGTMKTWAQW